MSANIYTLAYIRQRILKLAPGESVEATASLIDQEQLDEILSSIPGASYKFGYFSPFTYRNEHWFIFRVTDEKSIELETSTQRTWVCPDRRHLYKQDHEGIWSLNQPQHDPL